MADAYAVTSIFKPNADLSNVAGYIENLCKGRGGGGGRKQFG
jgi:hypothetical protein